MKRTYKDWGHFFHSQVRVGKGGKGIKVTKIRTMKNNAHSQHEKEYKKLVSKKLERTDHLDERVASRWMKVLRRSHLDELPQLKLLLQGKLKLAGIRPLTKHAFKTLPKDIQRIYLEMGPGFISVMYAKKIVRNREELHELYRQFYKDWKKSPAKAYAKWGLKSIMGIAKDLVKPRKK